MNTVPDYFYRQSGVIPYRVKEGELQVLLVTSRKKKKWIIPKGVVEPYMTPQQSAAQEGYEEAGVFGRVWDEPLGMFEVVKWGGKCTVVVFPMLVTKIYKEWPEDDFRKRKWITPQKALEMVSKQDVKLMLEKFIAGYGR